MSVYSDNARRMLNHGEERWINGIVTGIEATRKSLLEKLNIEISDGVALQIFRNQLAEAGLNESIEYWVNLYQEHLEAKFNEPTN